MEQLARFFAKNETIIAFANVAAIITLSIIFYTTFRKTTRFIKDIWRTNIRTAWWFIKRRRARIIHNCAIDSHFYMIHIVNYSISGAVFAFSILMYMIVVVSIFLSASVGGVQGAEKEMTVLSGVIISISAVGLLVVYFQARDFNKKVFERRRRILNRQALNQGAGLKFLYW